ncbi:hypothetical protein R5R35_010940 [Gryllus longicercus]|uniref:Ubiquitin-like domain-containing protein n=1 Tax=Gryllus longicercus TaxID=2509291 RepID=A0AAN9VDT2_9ORTH
MKIIVKSLQGQEATIEVTPEMNILELKGLIVNTLGIPVKQQRIIFAGNCLAEGKIGDHAVREGSILHILIKTEEPETTVLRDSTYRFLRQYYNERDSKKVVELFMKRFNQSMTTLSLDDLERIATSFLQDEERL